MKGPRRCHTLAHRWCDARRIGSCWAGQAVNASTSPIWYEYLGFFYKSIHWQDKYQGRGLRQVWTCLEEVAMSKGYWETVTRSRIGRRRFLLSSGGTASATLFLAACGK